VDRLEDVDRHDRSRDRQRVLAFPSLIALSAAELDGISDGRVVLGPQDEHSAADRRRSRTAVRTAGVTDGGVHRHNPSGWTGDRLDYDGDFYSPSGGRLLETPVQDEIPIAVAALGPSNRRLTGAKGDIWLPHLVPKTVLGDLAEDVYGAARDRERSADAIDVYAYVPTTAIDEDIDAAYDRVRRHVATYAGSAEPYRDAIADAGYDVAMEVHRTWQDGDRDAAAQLVTDELVKDIGLVGTPDDAPSACSQWHDAGADMVVMNFPPGSSVDDIRTALAAVS